MRLHSKYVLLPLPLILPSSQSSPETTPQKCLTPPPSEDNHLRALVPAQTLLHYCRTKSGEPFKMVGTREQLSGKSEKGKEGLDGVGNAPFEALMFLGTFFTLLFSSYIHLFVIAPCRTV